MPTLTECLIFTTQQELTGMVLSSLKNCILTVGAEEIIPYFGASLMGHIENATQRAAFASMKRSFSVNGLSITLIILAS